MAITLACGLRQDQIRCPGCGHVRHVDCRQARRWREGHIEGICVTCRGVGATRKARDRDVGYWLRLHGAEIPRGVKARDHLAASGMPESLVEFARGCFPQ